MNCSSAGNLSLHDITENEENPHTIAKNPPVRKSRSDAGLYNRNTTFHLLHEPSFDDSLYKSAKQSCKTESSFFHTYPGRSYRSNAFHQELLTNIGLPYTYRDVKRGWVQPGYDGIDTNTEFSISSDSQIQSNQEQYSSNSQFSSWKTDPKSDKNESLEHVQKKICHNYQSVNNDEKTFTVNFLENLTLTYSQDSNAGGAVDSNIAAKDHCPPVERKTQAWEIDFTDLKKTPKKKSKTG